MRPTEILSEEHRIIEVVLASLEEFVAESRAAARVDRDTAEKFIDFIRTFADGCHHGKEEKHLFTMLEEKGASREHGPVGVMLYEHMLGRSYVKAMAENVAAACAGEVTGLQQFCDNADGYVQLLRVHIAKEDDILFPLADSMLSESDQQALGAAFTHVESHDMGDGTHTRYLEMAEELAQKLAVPAAPIKRQISLGGCSCSHAAEVHAKVAANE